MLDSVYHDVELPYAKDVDVSTCELDWDWVGLITVVSSLLFLQLQNTDVLDKLEQLINLNNGEGQIYTVDGSLCLKNVQSMFGLVEFCYIIYIYILDPDMM